MRFAHGACQEKNQTIEKYRSRITRFKKDNNH